jgi:hypothetical protein
VGVVFGLVVAGILTAAATRHKESSATPPPPPGDSLDLARNPDILFHVFGARNDVRMIPIAALLDGRLAPIVLDSAGWRRLDTEFLRRGKAYALYQDGNSQGIAHVQRGMWERDEPVYDVKGCAALRPQALVRLEGEGAAGFSVEMFASSAQLGRRHRAQPLEGERLAEVARRLAAVAGERAELSAAALDSLDFRAVAVPTGVSDEPTVVTSWLDSTASAATSPNAATRHLFVIADGDGAGTYTASFVHRVNGPLNTAEFRRYIDHLDLNGDGVDELVLEGWRMRGNTFIAIMAREDGRWHEIFRSPSRWCLDPGSSGR